MPKNRYLLNMLAGIFIFQGVIFTYGFVFCSQNGGLKTCPELGERYDQTFSLMVATTLGLLTGNVLKE